MISLVHLVGVLLLGCYKPRLDSEVLCRAESAELFGATITFYTTGYHRRELIVYQTLPRGFPPWIMLRCRMAYICLLCVTQD